MKMKQNVSESETVLSSKQKNIFQIPRPKQKKYFSDSSTQTKKYFSDSSTQTKKIFFRFLDPKKENIFRFQQPKQGIFMTKSLLLFSAGFIVFSWLIVFV